MMEKMKYYEKLSAYLDGEFTQEEIDEIETRLALDEDLRKELAELKFLKESVKKSLPPLPESPYFETRLFAELKRPVTFGERFRKFIPVTAIAVITIALMVVFRFNPHLLQHIVEEQKTNLAGFYKQNLQPLLYAANLSNEDIFNFAFYHQLPLNKKDNQYLHLGYDKSGNEFFEIQTASAAPGPNTLDNFVKTLNLNTSQKHKVDSMLQAYADEIQNQVLVNDKNTVAINPNIWNFNKAIVADLMAFAQDANKEQFEKIAPGVSFVSNGNVSQIVNKVKSSNNGQYIFITPDTIFSDNYVFDKQKFKNEMKKMKEDLRNAGKEMREYAVNIKIDSNMVRMHRSTPPDPKNFRVNLVDANVYRVEVPEVYVPELNLPDFEAINKQIEEAANSFKFYSFGEPEGKSGKHQFNFKFKDENGRPVDININVDSMMNNIPVPPKTGKRSKMNFNMQMNLDSLMTSLKLNGMDSMQTKEFNKQMKELQKELKKFREEMMDMKKQFQKQKRDTVDEEPIEI